MKYTHSCADHGGGLAVLGAACDRGWRGRGRDGIQAGGLRPAERDRLRDVPGSGLGVGGAQNPVVVRHLSAGQIALILAGGFAYTVGMVVLWRRWPDPRPRRFGYHEVWHLFTIVAAALHFAAVASVVR